MAATSGQECEERHDPHDRPDRKRCDCWVTIAAAARCGSHRFGGGARAAASREAGRMDRRRTAGSSGYNAGQYREECVRNAN